MEVFSSVIFKIFQVKISIKCIVETETLCGLAETSMADIVSWAQCYTFFIAVIYTCLSIAGVFVPGRPIKSSPMFVGKARSLTLRRVPERSIQGKLTEGEGLVQLTSSLR
jgi:hypothetical protein